MRLFLIPLIILYAAIISMAVGIHVCLKRKTQSTGKHKWTVPAWDTLNFCILTALTVVVSVNFDTWWKMWLLFGLLTFIIAEGIGCLIAMLGRLPRLWHRQPVRGAACIGIAMGVGMFGFMWWGALVTRLTPHLETVTVDIPHLPKSFDGYRIVQLSDFHVGTFGKDTSFPARVVAEVNALKPDLIVFTGDLVNSRASELMPFTDVLSQLKARDGVMAILGNHDYADYSYWENDRKKQNDRDWLHTMQCDMGWIMLCDSTATIARGDDRLYIVGVENIGEYPFAVYGSLKRADQAPVDGVKILLTHNPRHWNDSVMNRAEMDYALTMSGHTHAMQMRLGKWSPAKYKYPQWGGLYTDTLGRHLYVNIGIGAVGMPARLGNANPEITLLTLRASGNPVTSGHIDQKK